MKPATDIGIDLGTTFSVIAANGDLQLAEDYPPGIYLEECNVTIIPTPYGERAFPSVIADDPDRPSSLIFGTDALQSLEDSNDSIMFFKRKIGTSEEIPLKNRLLTASDVSASLLGYMKRCTERALGREVRRAVITHPAYFDRAAVNQTRNAAIMAGFDMENAEQMLMEPVAAALAYTHSDSRDPLRVITYDLGGGTFDVTCLERSGGVIEMLSFDGNPLLGGYNFDRILVHWILKKLAARGRKITLDEETVEGRSQINRLLRLAERVKIALAEAESDTESIPIRGRYILKDDTGKEVPIDERITRKEYVSLIKHLLERTLEQVRKALKNAEMRDQDIDEILLVGGSSRGPWISEMINRSFPHLSCRLFNPDLCIAAGAAIRARMLLPPLVSGKDAELELLLDVPERISIDIMKIQGYLRRREMPAESYTVNIESQSSELKKSSQTDKQGLFSFSDVELEDSGDNHFSLEVIDQDGHQIIYHPFTIAYEPVTSEASTVMSVLPRTLAVETVNGMVTIAEGGATLPVLCKQSFRRQNNNPNISLKLFQDYVSIGEIRIENIPPEYGAGSRVDLNVELTEKGDIKGKAHIREPGGGEAITSDINIRITPPAVPDKEELKNRLKEIRNFWNDASSRTDKLNADLDSIVKERLKEIAELFEQMPLERQEIKAELDALDRIIRPPDSSLQPSLPKLMEDIRACQEILEDILKEKPEHEQQEDDKSQSGSDSSARRRWKRKKRKAKRMLKKLQELKTRAIEAHQLKDRRTWARVNETVINIRTKAQEQEHVGTKPPPGFLTKIFALSRVDELLKQLNSAASMIKAKGRIEDWQGEIRRIFAGLHKVKKEIEAIDDNSPDDQALARCRQLNVNLILPLQRAIENIGVDISKIGGGSSDNPEHTPVADISTRIGFEERIDWQDTRTLLDAGYSSVFEAVIEDAAEVDRRDQNGNTPLMVASAQNKIDLMKILIDKGAGIDIQNNDGNTALMYAQKFETASVLLEAGADPDIPNLVNNTALMYAVIRGDTELVNLLIDHGASVDIRIDNGQTPLITAAFNGLINTVRLLLEKGAEIDLYCFYQRTPLHYAASNNQLEVVKILVEGEAVIDRQDVYGCTALFYAAWNGHVDVVSFLLSKGADTSLIRHQDKANPLNAAAHAGHPEVVKLLASKTPNLEFKDKDGDTALINAASSGCTECVKIILKNGAQINTMNDYGQNALFLGAIHGHSEVVDILLSNGIESDTVDIAGKTALDYAREKGHQEVIAMLEKS